MARENTEDLIARLARDTRPVIPIGRLRGSLARGGFAWLLTAAAAFVLLGPWPDALVAISTRVPSGLVWLGLLAMGLGGLLYGGAAAVPGRDGARRLGLGSAALGACCILAAPLLGSFPLASELYRQRALSRDSTCCGLALLSALPVAIVSLKSCRRSAPLWPASSALALALGSIGLGALGVQTLCPEASAWHTLAAHVVGPALAVPILTLILTGALRRSFGEPAGLPSSGSV
jgi:hypothetical protein